MADTAEMVGTAPSGDADTCGTDAALAAADPFAALAALRARGADHVDPVRFHFLEALARRVRAQQGEARRFLDLRLAQAIDDYAGRFAQAQDEARAALTAAAERHADAADGLRQLFDAGDFAALRRRIVALAHPAMPTPLAALSALAASLVQPADSDPAGPVDPADPAPAAAREPQPVAAGELKSLRYFRDTWAQLSVAQQLTEALAQAPENAGPLNSHLLVLRALERMRDVSPDYLNRFMSYVDALLWLEQTDGGALLAEKNAATGDGDRKKSRSAAATGKTAKQVR